MNKLSCHRDYAVEPPMTAAKGLFAWPKYLREVKWFSTICS